LVDFNRLPRVKKGISAITVVKSNECTMSRDTVVKSLGSEVGSPLNINVTMSAALIISGCMLYLAPKLYTVPPLSKAIQVNITIVKLLFETFKKIDFIYCIQ
jgi:hypothetical protein